MDKKKLLIVGGVAGVAVFVWWKSRSSSTGATTNPGIVTPSGWSPTISSDIYLLNPVPATTNTPGPNVLPVLGPITRPKLPGKVSAS